MHFLIIFVRPNRGNKAQGFAMKNVRLKCDSLSHAMSEVNSSLYIYLHYSTSFIAIVVRWLTLNRAFCVTIIDNY